MHYEGIHRIDPESGERADVVDEVQEAVVQCLDCMHDQPHLGFQNGRVEPIEDRWERMVEGTPWVASCTVTVETDEVESCSGPDAADHLSFAAFGDHGTREFFTHVRFHKHDEDKIVVHLLVELYARSRRGGRRACSRTPRAARSRSPRSPRSHGRRPPPRRPALAAPAQRGLAVTPGSSRSRADRRPSSRGPTPGSRVWVAVSVEDAGLGGADLGVRDPSGRRSWARG